jgi:hypothetical protein
LFVPRIWALCLTLPITTFNVTSVSFVTMCVLDNIQLLRLSKCFLQR